MTTTVDLAGLAESAFEAARDTGFSCSPMEEELEALRKDAKTDMSVYLDAGWILDIAEEIEALAVELEDTVSNGEKLVRSLRDRRAVAS